MSRYRRVLNVITSVPLEVDNKVAHFGYYNDRKTRHHFLFFLSQTL